MDEFQKYAGQNNPGTKEYIWNASMYIKSTTGITGKNRNEDFLERDGD